MQDVYKRIDKIAPTDISVLITGETGTGKELIAREIHRRSPRAKGPFITINCGAIPENLLESELFGHVKGAFTGAVATRPGKFQAAIGGTLFLDEIGEMPLQLQVKLLRALQEKVVYKVGDNRGEPVDIRVVAATNRILEEEVKRNAFREDLYYRLNVVTLKLPPLRERGEDVVVLGKFFLQKYAQGVQLQGARLHPRRAPWRMKKYGWPGNIRELENRIKKAVVLADKPLLGAGRSGPAPGEPGARSCRSPRPRRSSRSATSTRCWSGTTATAPRRPRTSAWTRAPSSATWRSWRPSARAASSRRIRTASPRSSRERRSHLGRAPP